MIYIGIDPGAGGGIAWTHYGLPHAEKWQNEIEANHVLRALIQESKSVGGIKAVLEQVNAMPGNGCVSMFNFGQNFGMWKGLLVAHQIPFTTVRPQVWQKEIPGRKGVKGTQLKQLLKAEAQRRFPHLKITNATADALLIADYCRRVS